MKLSELRRVTVAKPQVRGREAQDERSGRQTRDHRNTNWQRGRVRAASVRVNAKPNPPQDAPGRARWPARKVQALTWGDLSRESEGEVSKGRSSVEASRKRGGAKGRSTKRMAQPRATQQGERPLQRTARTSRTLPWTGGRKQNRCSRGEQTQAGSSHAGRAKATESHE